MIEDPKQVYEFDEFRLDVRKRQLMRQGEVVPLYSKAFDLLLVLVQNGGRDVTKDELLETVWPDQTVEEANLTVNMSAVRKALGEKAARPRYIINIPGRGYRFVGNLSGDEVGLVIESQTIAQITVEQDGGPDSDEAIELPARSTSPRAAPIAVHPHAQQLALPSAPSPSLFRRPVVLIALVLGGSVLVLAAIVTIFEIRRARTATSRFQQIKLRQLTNDGRVINAEISPDGRFFVFVHSEKEKNSLRLGQTNGQPPIELRPSAEIVYRGIAFAPDGNSVYYVIEDHDRHSLYRMSVLGGVPVKLGGEVDAFFAIAPDNKRVVFARGDVTGKTRSLIVMDLDTDGEKVVLTLPANRNLSSINLSWSPDGANLALAATPVGNQTTVEIFLLRIGSAELTPLPGSLWREVARTVWLKDGSGLIVNAASTGTLEGRQVWFVALPDGNARRITNDLTNYDISLSVTADLRNLLSVEHQQMTNIWVAPVADLSKATQLTFGALNRGDGGLGLDWTPDGKIVYTSVVAQSKTIWIMDVDGSNARELTPPGANESTPSVTGDGRYLVFDSDRSGSLEIWRARMDGSEPKQLTTCGRNFEPNASPDGKWVVYESSCDSSGGLWRVPIDGGPATRLTEKAAWWPWVSPDSKWVACEYSVEGTSQLAIIPIDGGPPAKLFDIPPQANFRYAIRWTADGKAVTYRDWGKGVWRQSIDGGAPQSIQGLPDEKTYSNGWSRDGKMFAFTRGVEIRDVVLISTGH